jgi:hypothetical protein
MILVEYRCASCAGVSETPTTWPFPTNWVCGGAGVRLGGFTRRLGFGGLGAGGGRVRRGRSWGVCVVGFGAGVWAARVRGDDRALRAATLRQERFLERTGQTPQELAAIVRTAVEGRGPGSVEPGS